MLGSESKRGTVDASASESSASDHPVCAEDVKDSTPKCACGYDRHHHLVSQERSYTSWGSFWVMLMGVSASPIRIDFKCRRCKEKFDFITNSRELKRYL
jgi:hypothetical protein